MAEQPVSYPPNIESTAIKGADQFSSMKILSECRIGQRARFTGNRLRTHAPVQRQFTRAMSAVTDLQYPNSKLPSFRMPLALPELPRLMRQKATIVNTSSVRD